MRVGLIVVLALFLAAGCGGSRRMAEPPPATVDAALAEADSLRAAGRFEEARAAYDDLRRTERGGEEAYLGLARLAVDAQTWTRAGELLDEVLARDSSNVEAHYLRGIVHRELGRFRPPLTSLRNLLDWRSAARHFEFVLARDSAYRDVLAQYALLEHYRDNEPNAIRLAHEQVRANPGDPAGHLGLAWIYRLHLAGGRLPEWLAADTSEYTAFFRAEARRLDGDLDEARAEMQALLEAPRAMLPDAPILLALARVAAAKEEPEAAEDAVQRVVDASADPVAAAFLFDDFKYVMTDEEVVAYERTPPAGMPAYFRGLWTRRDPLPAAERNVRLVEHYRRLVKAEQDFAYVGARGWFNEPDKVYRLDFPRVYRLNRAFNDRGLIYLRHGEPDEQVRTLGPTVESNVSWRYHSTSGLPPMDFHFMTLGGAAWRLVPVLRSAAMLNDRLTWGNAYAHLYQVYTQGRELEVMGAETEMYRASQAVVDTALATDRHSWPDDLRPLDMQFVSGAFRGAEGQTLLEIYYAVPMAEVVREVGSSRRRLPVEMGVSVHDPDWREVAHELETRSLGLTANPADAIVHSYRLPLPPDSYHVALHFRPEGTRLLAGYKFDKRLPDFSGAGLSMSDLLLASRVEPAADSGAFVRGGLRVVVNPTQRFSREQAVYVYFEVYNLTLGGDDRTSYAIEYELRPEEGGGFRLFGRRDRPVLSVAANHEGESIAPVEYGGIDMGEVDAGTYTLRVTVTDRHTGASAERSARVILQ